MSFTLVAHTAANGATSGGVTTSSINTTGADFLVLIVSDYQATTASTPTDSKSNTWTALTPQATGVFNRCKIWYCKNPTVGSGHTFTYTLTAGFSSLAVAAFSGSDTSSPFDQQNGASTSGATTIQPGSVTPSQANELIVVGLAETNSGSVSINGGFTISDQVDYVPGTAFGVSLAYLIQTTATAENPTWTWVASTESATCIATFKAGSASPTAVITEQNLPANHAGNITVHAVGTGTSWTSSTTWTPSGVSGWTIASKTQVDGTHYTIVLTPPTAATPPTGATGTLTLTEGVTGSAAATTTVGTPTLGISPTSGTTGTTPTLTMTGANTIWQSETAAGLFTVSGGTGASLATPTVTNDTAATDVLTVGSGSGTLTINDTSTGATASFTASPPSPPTSGTATFTNATNTQVNASCTAASGGTSPYTYQWQFCTTATGSFANISGQTSLTLADTVNNLGFRQLVTTDNVGSTATSNLIYGGRWLAPTVILGGIGDSIMAGYPNTAGVEDPLTRCAHLLGSTLNTLRGVTLPSNGNQALAGTKTSQWLPAAVDDLLPPAAAVFATNLTTDIVFMLGTNDARSDVTGSTYGSNLSSIFTYLFANVPTLLRIWPCYPPWSTDTGTLTAARYELLVVDYESQIDSKVNGTTILHGDVMSAQWFAAHIDELGDGIHPTVQGDVDLGGLWARGLSQGLNPISSGGGFGGDSGLIIQAKQIICY